MRTAYLRAAALLVAACGADEPGTGGVVGDGGGADAPSSAMCTGGVGTRLAGAARRCASTADCDVLVGGTCCTQSAYGIAKTAMGAYGGCFQVDQTKCNTDCMSPNWYATDTGALTPLVDYGTDARRYVTVGCVKSLCTTDALPLEAGADGAAASDATASDATAE
jgi:hypothetical protein